MSKGVGDLARMALNAGRTGEGGDREIVDVITFCEADWGLKMRLFPVQRVILKAHYGIPLDDDPSKTFTITDWRRENPREYTEAGYLRYLYEEGRSNIKEVIPGQERKILILSVGRRSGKTLISSCIAAYETYKLINKGDPQKYYGFSPSSVVQLISVATGKDQAGLLYNEVSGHFAKCSFFKRYTANHTMSYARFQSPKDIEQFGSYHNNPKARAGIKVTFHACNAKGLRGAGNLVIILDEVAHFIEQGGSSAEEVYQAVAPSAATFTPKNELGLPINGKATKSDGRIIMISSPLGKQGLFYKKFRQGMAGGAAASNMLCIQAPTWEVNPTVSAEVFQEYYAEDARVFFTEFGAEFTDRTLGWLEDPEDLFSCIDKQARPRTRGQARRPYFMGFDLGLVNDASAMAIVHINEESKIVLDYIGQIKAGEGEFLNKDRLEFEDVAAWIHQVSRMFNIREGLFDQWNSIPLEQALAKKGLQQIKSEHMSAQRNSEIFQNLKSMIWDKRLVLYDITEQDKAKLRAREEPVPEHLEYIQQLLELQAEYKSKYVVSVQAPQTDGKHDDLPDALARAVWLASQHMGKLRHIAGVNRQASPHTQSISPSLRRSNRRKRLLGGSDPKRQVPRTRRR
jgi:hypothetical protein